ncbi:MAG: hypothetical protein V1872_01385 [bacterium]
MRSSIRKKWLKTIYLFVGLNLFLFISSVSAETKVPKIQFNMEALKEVKDSPDKSIMPEEKKIIKGTGTFQKNDVEFVLNDEYQKTEVSYIFNFTNIGSSDLEITEVKASG